MTFYPFENFWLNCIGEKEHNVSVLEKFEKPIQGLSDQFTLDRPKNFTNYTTEENLLAYGLFFFPQTFVRVQFPMQEILNVLGWKPLDEKPLRVLDVGSGLGAGGLSVLWKLREKFSVPLEYTAYDHSPDALQFLLRHADELLPKDTVLSTEIGDLKHLFKRFKEEDKWDVILFSFSLNEGLGNATQAELERYLQQVIRLLAPNGFLLCVEPLLKTRTDILQKAVEALDKQKKAHLWAPGFGTAYPGKDLPHDVRSWDPPESLKILNRKLFRSIEFLKYHFFVLGAEPMPLKLKRGPEICRLISPMIEAKGRFLWQGWGSDGKLYAYDLPTRDLNKAEIASVQKLQRGDVLSLKNLEAQKLEDHFRLTRASDIDLYLADS